MRTLSFILFVFVTFSCWGNVQQDSLQLTTDTNGSIQERQLEDLNKKYQGEEFNYDIKTGESQNLVNRFLNWLGRGLNDVFGIRLSPGTLKFLQYLIYVLMSGVVLYLIVRLLINEKLSSIFTKKAKTILDIDIQEQHIEQLDLDGLLKTALEQRDYRLAIRYHYLKSLKKLSQGDVIEWHFDKTNSDYEREIKEPLLKKGFKKIAYLYDYIWYGEQLIDAVAYERAKQSFTQLNNTIRQ